ncbi:MAG: pyrroline-5-carboxylate reductase [Verrucomicrobia bacterium]|jgi:pyrroline-5-carboxylate reductase|nr:pyrroline-5-carboxylate reductase [Verrucomicrobiota bacterium]|tara:strand:+ start:5677 stop:6480 length:804 start_codon:yes stop_codon:yes gene_type:complete
MKLGVIGCGKMATALVKGVIDQGVVNVENVMGVARTENSRQRFSDETGAAAVSDIADVLGASDVLLLCTKPQDIVATLAGCLFKPEEPKLLVSVAAGVTLATLESTTPDSVRVVRCMPNTPSLVGKGATAFSLGARCVEGDLETVEKLLGAVGISVEVPEKQMDAVTGLSGSGPAYIYLIIEALADGAVRQGLPRAEALRLAAQTVSGAAEMVIRTGMHPAVLKDMVTSPGGTTITGLSVLEEKNVRSALISAVSAATQRAVELGKA